MVSRFKAIYNPIESNCTAIEEAELTANNSKMIIHVFFLDDVIVLDKANTNCNVTNVDNKVMIP